MVSDGFCTAKVVPALPCVVDWCIWAAGPKAGRCRACAQIAAVTVYRFIRRRDTGGHVCTTGGMMLRSDQPVLRTDISGMPLGGSTTREAVRLHCAVTYRLHGRHVAVHAARRLQTLSPGRRSPIPVHAVLRPSAGATPACACARLRAAAVEPGAVPARPQRLPVLRRQLPRELSRDHVTPLVQGARSLEQRRHRRRRCNHLKGGRTP